jgi:hypothetical protein
MSCQCEEDIVSERFQTNPMVENATNFDLSLEVRPGNISQLFSQIIPTSTAIHLKAALFGHPNLNP